MVPLMAAFVAIARTFLVTIWQLLSNTNAASMNPEPATTPAAVTRRRKPATISGSWKDSGTPSPSLGAWGTGQHCPWP
jgi:hypothetical protein